MKVLFLLNFVVIIIVINSMEDTCWVWILKLLLCVYRPVAGQGCLWRIAYEDNKTGWVTDEDAGVRQDGGSGNGQR